MKGCRREDGENRGNEGALALTETKGDSAGDVEAVGGAVAVAKTTDCGMSGGRWRRRRTNAKGVRGEGDDAGVVPELR